MSGQNRKYQLPVLIGNWYEDKCLTEDERSHHETRRDGNMLATQRVLSVDNTLTRLVELTVSPDGVVRYGDVVRVYQGGASERSGGRGGVRRGEGGSPPADSVLAVSLTLTQIVESVHPARARNVAADEEQLGMLTASTQHLQSVGRNSFIITNPKGNNSKEVLRYKEPFLLVAVENPAGNDRKAYIHSDPVLFQTPTKSRNQSVNLVLEPTYGCYWYCQCYDPRLRLETLGLPVLANVPLIITHAKTGKNLAVEKSSIINTMFGQEFEVTAATYYDSHRAEMPPNHFCLCLPGPGYFLQQYDGRTEHPMDRQETREEGDTDLPHHDQHDEDIEQNSPPAAAGYDQTHEEKILDEIVDGNYSQ